MNTIQQRVANLRDWMKQEGIDIFLVPTLDPHNSEYVAEYWKCRQWLTGFTGSAGTAVVTADEALLWTDSRYWIQAGEQLLSTPFTLMREGEDIDISEWFFRAVWKNPGVRIGFAPDMMTPEAFESFFVRIRERRCSFVYDSDPFSRLWNDRPALPKAPAMRIPDEIAGKSANEKLRDMILWMQERRMKRYLLTDLSEICWMLNLRGGDVPYNPFLIAFLDVRTNEPSCLYVEPYKMMGLVSYLQSIDVSVHCYNEGLLLQRSQITEPRIESPVPFWRAMKNTTEQEGFREAHRRDGVAMVRFLAWLDRTVEGGGEMPTEMDIDRRLTALRMEQPGCCGLSFETIAAYGPHGAIVHYEATPQTDVRLERRGLLLLDSGAHYDCGTTDITRTIALGALTDEERKAYTLVLKGHLQLARAVFPENTTGLQLDTLARASMWREGMDYGHGTGHGVGHRLGVHEGPVQIRKNLRACTTLPFRAGQTITDEPGIYVAGRFGVRIENTLLTQPAFETPMGHFLHFEDLTLCPYDLRPVLLHMLTHEERQWLNDYHQRVAETLMPFLTDEADREWLRRATQKC